MERNFVFAYGGDRGLKATEHVTSEDTLPSISLSPKQPGSEPVTTSVRQGMRPWLLWGVVGLTAWWFLFRKGK